MRNRIIGAALVGSVLLTAVPAHALQCVLYAREASGISLRGDAWTWWSSAAGAYDRGQAPGIGAVVVFKKHGSMRHGHVAVVTQVVGSREVLVDHANWAPRRGHDRGRVSKMVAVTDVSPRNDWTEVRVWNADIHDYGSKTYPTYGFIYPQGPHLNGEQAHFMSTNQPSATAMLVSAIMPVSAMPLPQVVSDSGREPVKNIEVIKVATPAPASVPAPKQAEVKVVVARVEDVKLTQAVDRPVEKMIEAKPVEPKVASIPVPVAPLADAVSEDDAALARRFGAGRY